MHFLICEGTPVLFPVKQIIELCTCILHYTYYYVVPSKISTSFKRHLNFEVSVI